MTLNFPGPVEVRLFYTTAEVTHEARYNCNSPTDLYVGMTADLVDIYDRDGIHGTLEATIDEWVDLIKVLYSNATATFDYAELWEYDGETHVGKYILTYPIGVAGTSGTATRFAQQDIFSFRTEEGGSMRIELLETFNALNTVLSYTGMTAAQQALVDFVISTSGWILARDTSYPVAFFHLLQGQNEAVFKRRFR